MNDIKNKVNQFLKDNDVHYEDIDMDKCCDIFMAEMNAGLVGQDSSLAMIPTYIEVGKDIEANKPVIVLDAGGTNFRIATVYFDDAGKPVIENYIQKPMPGIEKEASKEEFFETIVNYMTNVVNISSNIGFCFSYPTEILPNRDGRLIRFCKEVKAKKVEGELIGENLVSAIGAAGYESGKRVVILNDTVATLLAGMSAFPNRAFDSYIGFILGTGSNCCYIESNENIKKKPELEADREQIINVESGSFSKAPRGKIDLKLDESTLDPGMYTFEKMFSGAYFGALCLKAIQTASEQGIFSKEVSAKFLVLDSLETKEVNDFLQSPNGDNSLAECCKNGNEQDYTTVWYILDALIERAAKLVAVLLSSVVLKTDKGKNPCAPVCITAEGTTFYHLKSLKTKVAFYLKKYLEEQHNRFVEVVAVENATLIGAAIAGLTN